MKNKCRTSPLFREQGMALSRQAEECMSNESHLGHTHHPLGRLSPKTLIADHILQRGDVLSCTVSALNDAEAGHY